MILKKLVAVENPYTGKKYVLGKKGVIEIRVYDVSGEECMEYREVRIESMPVLEREYRITVGNSRGYYSVVFSGVPMIEYWGELAD